MKFLILLVAAAFLAQSVSYAAVGVTKKQQCKDIVSENLKIKPAGKQVSSAEPEKTDTVKTESVK